MHDIKLILADAVRAARTELRLSQEKLAEALGVDTRTILNIEAGRGNPKFEVLYLIITYLRIPTDKIFYPDNENERPNLQKLIMEFSNCSEKEVEDLLPAVRYLINLIHK